MYEQRDHKLELIIIGISIKGQEKGIFEEKYVQIRRAQTDRQRARGREREEKNTKRRE